MMKLKCPNCGGDSKVVNLGADYVHVCMCGLHKFLIRVNEDGTATLCGVSKNHPKVMPKKGTKLYNCLLQLAGTYPAPLSTLDISNLSDIFKENVASMLVVLMGKGLITRVRSGKGVKGGSIWALASPCVKFFNLE